MADISLTVAEGILKFDYRDMVRDVLNSAVVLNFRLERDYETVAGDRVWFPLNTGRNPSFASRAPGADLPFRGTQEYKPTFFTVPEMYGRFQVSQRDIKASRNSKGAFLRVLDSEMRHLIRDAKVSLNRMNFGDGSGIIARADDADPGADATHGLDEEKIGDAGGTTETYYAVRFLSKNQRINYIASADKGDETKQGILTIPKIVSSTTKGTAAVKPTVTYTDAVFDAVVADSDWLIIDGSHVNDQMGLLGIVDDGDATLGFVDTIQGIQRTGAGNEFWQANVLRNPGTPGTNREVTLDLYQEALDLAEEEGDGLVSVFLTDYGIRRKTLALMVQDKRFTSPYELELDGGFRALSYNGIPIIPDKDCPRHKIFGLDEPTLKFYQMSDLEWMEEDGAVLNRVANQPLYEATLFLYRELASSDMRNNVLIDDIIDPSNPNE